MQNQLTDCHIKYHTDILHTRCEDNGAYDLDASLCSYSTGSKVRSRTPADMKHDKNIV